MELEANSEDRYESINLIIKARLDGESWFDVIHDYLSQDCEGIFEEELPDGNYTDGKPCTCGMETMSGMSGTLQQCYDAGTAVGKNLQPIDLALAILEMDRGVRNDRVLDVLTWAIKEVEFNNWLKEGLE